MASSEESIEQAYLRGVRETEERLFAEYEVKLKNAYDQGAYDKALEIGKLQRDRARLKSTGQSKMATNEASGRAQHQAHESSGWHLRYFEELLNITCGADLLDAEVFNIKGSAKELTEAFAAFAAIRKYLCVPGGFDAHDPSVTAIVVGDGSTPRAGAVIAMRTSWTVHSVDPQMKTEGPWSNVKHLHAHRQKIQDMRFDESRVVIIMVHCHVSMEDALASLTHRPSMLGVVTAPCCHFADLQTHVYGLPPLAQFEDISMASGKRDFRVWLVLEQ